MSVAIVDEDGLRALFVAALAGDNAAYAAFLGHVGARLRGYYRRRASMFADDIEDLVQEAMLAIHNQRHSYRSDQPVTAWLYAIARYKLIDWIRARATRTALLVPIADHDDDVAMASSEPQALEARRDLLVLVASLPDRFRLPILHVKIEGLSIAEAASLLGMTQASVKIGIHRGLKALAVQVRKSS
ncbi:MAG: sigma-70 family RNA polymerase sigma factor [Caldimonas sp.]